MKQRNILTIVFTLFCVATIMAQNVDNEKTGIPVGGINLVHT